MAKKGNKVKVFLISALIIVMALGGLVPAFLANYNKTSPSAPIVLDDGEKVFITTSFNDNYKGYQFKFVASDGQEFFVVSEENVIDCDQVVEAGGKLGETYKISVCFLGQSAENNSEYSPEKEWTCEAYLSSTIINYDVFSNMLNWAEVENADYYRLYYNDNNEVSFIDISTTSYDLSQFEGGEKIMYIVACSNNVNLKTSAKSNILDFNLKHYFSEFSNLSFDKTTNILTAENAELLEKLEIMVGETIYLNNKFSVEQIGTKYIYKIDLTTVYNNERIIGICPSDIDEFNLYYGDMKTIEVSA